MDSTKLGIVVSHPIQYYAPLFRTLAKEIDLKVFYCHNPSAKEIGNSGFGKSFDWDVDLLSGYEYEFVENVAESPSVSDYHGSDCPTIGESIQASGITHVVVFGWYLKALRQSLDFCNKNKIPIACRGDSQLNPDQVWYKRLIKKIYYPFFLNRYDAFLYVGKRNKQYLRHYGVKDHKLIFSPHAVDQQFWKGQKLTQDKFTFIWVAKFIEKKRPKDVIRAFQKVEQENTVLKMVGSGPLMKECQRMAENDERIEFLGFKNQTELRKEYLKSDALILSSNYEETWGLVVNEAFAAGVPAIVSEACGCSADLLTDDLAVLKYNPKELEGLYDKMMGVLMGNFKTNQFQDRIMEKNEIYSYQSNLRSFKHFISTL